MTQCSAVAYALLVGEVFAIQFCKKFISAAMGLPMDDFTLIAISECLS